MVGRSSQNKDSSLLLSSRSGSNERTGVTETTQCFGVIGEHGTSEVQKVT